MDERRWAERDAALVWHGFTDMSAYLDHCPVVVERAEGHELVDVDGRRYLDAISSLWVNTLGHRVPELDQAVRDQLDRVAHSTLLGHGNTVVVELAEALAGVVPVDAPHFVFCSDGASAVEQALKLAFQFWALSGVRGRTSYLAFGAAYHGDTVGAMSLGADDGFGAALFDPLRFPVLRAPGFDDPSCFDAACRLVDEHAGTLAAVVVEPLVQGAAGMKTAPPEGFVALAKACRAADVLLVHDEVATGFGRTGTLFATEQLGGVRPDLLCLGKGITGGYLPMAVTVASGRIYDAFSGHAFAHGHSYGGNALAAAVALRHLRLLHERAVLANVAARSAQLGRLLRERVGGAVRVEGLLCGVDVAPGTGRAVCDRAVAAGVLLRPIGDTVIIVPPLTITGEEVERIVDALAGAIAAGPGGGPGEHSGHVG
ncbi:MAG TPA: aminotransferase class III-fold pyridoxal phosphate-dependent enzyme [Acidimicrobiales bacterium]|nr:aminotransferase class III-fold pyridoxal phosphate-dependent enzyme [Acidimicrobiales bacterium]